MNNEIIIEGTVLMVFPVMRGTGIKGDYAKQSILVEYNNGKYTNKVSLWLWRDLIETVEVDDEVIIRLCIEAKPNREGFWNNHLSAYEIEKIK